MDNDRGQSLITKYVWVIETIYRRRKISFKELNELWLRDDISRGVEIPKRTFDNWRYVIWDMFGINNLQASAAQVVSLQFFTPDGRQVSRLQHGMNIIRESLSDGTTRTVKLAAR